MPPRTSQSKSQSKLTSSGAPAERAASATPAEEQTRDELYAEAARLGIAGRSRMRVSELRASVERARAEQPRRGRR